MHINVYTYVYLFTYIYVYMYKYTYKCLYMYIIEQDGERSAPILFSLVIKNNPQVKQIVRGGCRTSHLTPTREDKGDGCRTQF